MPTNTLLQPSPDMAMLFTIWMNPPISPCPTVSAKEIGRSDIIIYSMYSKKPALSVLYGEAQKAALVSHACCSKKQLQITGSVYLLDWTTGLDYCSHPNCRKISGSRQDGSLFTQLLCCNCSIACSMYSLFPREVKGHVHKY